MKAEWSCVEIMERHSVIINAPELGMCPFPVLQTEVLQLFWLSGHVDRIVFLDNILSVLIWFSVSTNTMTWIFQTEWARCLIDPLIHFQTPRNLLVKPLFTFLTPNRTFLRLTRSVCRCVPTGFVCAGFCLMGPLLNSFSIMRHQIYNLMA